MTDGAATARDYALVRGTVVLEGTVVTDGAVVVRGSVIEWVGSLAECPVPPTAADRQATWVIPGLVDVHNHGGGGFGFPDADLDGCLVAAGHHRSMGTTTMLASLVSAPVAVLERRVAVLADLVDDRAIAGIHLEGPFLSERRCGAHDPHALVPGDAGVVERIVRAGRGAVRSMTLAPELPGFADALAALRRFDVLPSLGHTDATSACFTDAVRAAAPGPLSVTHLFNAMSPADHRAPGAVTAALAAAARGDLVVELIADGVHLHPETVAAVFDLVGADRIALVSDAMAAAGMADGRYPLGSLVVEVVDGVARLATDDPGVPGAIAGGTARLVEVLRGAVAAGVPIAAAVRSASAVPAALLGLDREIGSLAAGKRADLVALDDDLCPAAVMHRGRWVPTDPDHVVVDERGVS